MNSTKRFTKHPPAVEQSCNCERHTASCHQDIANSQSCYEHVGKRAEPVVSVHGVKSKQISQKGHNVDKSEQNSLKPN